MFDIRAIRVKKKQEMKIENYKETDCIALC